MVNGERANDTRFGPYEFHQETHDQIRQEVDGEKQIGPFGPPVKKEERKSGDNLEYAFDKLDGNATTRRAAAVKITADLSDPCGYCQRNDKTAAEG